MSDADAPATPEIPGLDPDLHEPLRIRNRERPQADGVDELEDRRVGPDAESQRQDGNHREGGVHAELAHPVGQILPSGLDEAGCGHSVDLL